MAWFATKSAFKALLMLVITFLLASYRGTPIVLIVLAAFVAAPAFGVPWVLRSFKLLQRWMSDTCGTT